MNTTMMRHEQDLEAQEVIVRHNLLRKVVQVGPFSVTGHVPHHRNLLLAKSEEQVVVLKRLRCGRRRATREQIESEARLNALCHDHPSVCDCLGLLHSGQELFIVLQRAKYGNLRTFVQRHKPDSRLSVEQARVVMHQLVQATRHLHLVCGVAHRDIKPCNVLVLDPQVPRVALCDFGLAVCCNDDQPMAVPANGTAGCSPPERFLRGDRNKFSPRCADVFGLGSIFFFLLTGHLPFEGSSNRDIALHTIAQEFSVILTNLPADCEDLLFAMLDPDPRTRPKIDQVAAHPFFESQQ